MKKFHLYILLLILGWVLPAGGQVPEYELKAVYLFNFAKFVEWPSSAFAGDNTSFLIGVLGDDPFGDALDAAVKDRSIQGRPIRVKRFDNFDGTQTTSLRQCQILFICFSEKERIEAILQALEGAQVLTVSEIEKFNILGGMILFDQEGDRITLDVNPRAAQRVQLSISSKLLQVSKIYKSE